MNRAKFVRNYSALFDSSGKVKNYRKAFPLLMVAARNGHPHAQNLVGYCYDWALARVVTKEQRCTGTRKLQRMAMPKPFTTSLFPLCAWEGHLPRMNGKRSNSIRGLETMGHVWACCNLGTMYADGAGTKINHVLALKWWRKAAQKGDSKAQYNLGSSYADGRGVRADKRVAALWLKKAGGQGHKKAARELRALESVRASR